MRALCQLSNDTISVIDHAMAISDIKHAVIKGHFCEENGFTVGEVNISGDELYAGHTLQIQVKNENMAALLDQI